ncbi:galactose/methyl galactoside ABC transporter permease MglC [Oscillospiraceae bacterium MB08-C2-2]|nr:galactose/methyl galactoside ABC transporter permease MglC [Oscillospiraceae bacterium MB08-C2-2]
MKTDQAVKRRRPSGGNALHFIQQNIIFVVLLILIVAIAIINPMFVSLNVLKDLLIQNSTRLIIASGMALILIVGGVDLSAGRSVGLAAVIAASMMQTADYSRRFYPDLPQINLIIPVVIAVAVCALFGGLNGFLITKFSIPAFIATLGTQVAIFGINSIYFDLPPNSSQPIGGIRKDFTYFGSGFVGFVPIIILIALLILGMVWLILKKTPFGRNIYAIGGNKDAALVSGIKVASTTVLVYAIGGALFGLAGVLECARTGGGTNAYGASYEFDAIAACVVGGVSNTGGVGTIPGMIAGVFIFGIINYGLTFIGVNPYWQMIFKGLIIVAAVGVDISKNVKKR